MPGSKLKILAFETSCDDTSVAALIAAETDAFPQLLSLSVQSQDEVHTSYGGVVPELASRAHLRNILPCLRKVLRETKWSIDQVDLFVATAEPGLIGSLLIGHSAAKTLSLLTGRPFIGCNHLEGHLVSIFIEHRPTFPFLSALVSGGHTSLYLVKTFDDYELIGQTVDDAMGEAFDKGAQLFNLGFPGGAKLERFAQQGSSEGFRFPNVKVEGLNFSFSGLKSQLARLMKRNTNPQDWPHIAKAYQEGLISHFEQKLRRAIETTGVRTVVIVGGVARNLALRQRLEGLRESGLIDEVLAPRPDLCTDNAAMIGSLGFRKFIRQELSSFEEDVRSTSRPKRRAAR